MDALEQGRRSLVGASRAARGEVVGARSAANGCDSASLGAAPNGSEGSESALADLIGTDAAALALADDVHALCDGMLSEC
ncbi:hypothetical protein [Streptomyces tendae]|uniref:hypothetical protein n=1 Tax=Streptomyces tendae TaxID=1932 RepID=UPI002491900B|nr:hypothetical protein [Streptomyces tendae]